MPEDAIRLLMLIGGDRRAGPPRRAHPGPPPGAQRTARGTVEAIARGYPLTLLLAVLLVFLAGLAIWRKGWSLAKRWTDAHVPSSSTPAPTTRSRTTSTARSPRPASRSSLGRARRRCRCPRAGWRPSPAGRRWSLVPERLVQLKGQDLDILIYPMDLLISGKPSWSPAPAPRWPAG